MSLNIFFDIEYTKKEEEATNCWILDYKPTFDNLLFPKRIYEQFYNFVNDGYILLNMNISGCKGCGKITIINCILQHCYKIDLTYLKPHHKYNFIKNYTNIFYTDFQKLTNGEIKDCFDYIKHISKLRSIDDSYKLYILRNFDTLNRINQNRILHLMEKYVNNIRFITTSTHYNKLSKIFFSKVQNFRLPYMTDDEFKIFIKKIIVKNNAKINVKVALKIYHNNFFNLRDTILMCQYISNKGGKYESSMVSKIVIDILKYCSTFNYNNHILIREKVYSLSSFGISPELVIKIALNLIVKNKLISNEIKGNVIRLAGKVDHTLAKADRYIFSLEKFFFGLIDIFVNNI